jgi:hypothetical protein
VICSGAVSESIAVHHWVSISPAGTTDQSGATHGVKASEATASLLATVPLVSSSALRPLRVGEILDAGLKVYSRNARTLMGLTALVVVPFQTLSAVILLSTLSTGSEVPRGSVPTFGSTRPANHATSLGANAVLTLTGLLIDLLTTAACVKAVSDIYLDQPTDIGSSLRFAVRRLGSLVWLQILAGTLLVLAFIALVIPGIWLYVAWSVATPVLLIEGTGGYAALRRSFRLVRGRWWPSAGVLAVAAIMTSVVGAAIEGVLVGVFVAGSDRSVLLTVTLVSLAAAVSAILTRPFAAAVRTVLYYDLRVRHEGYDVTLLAEQLGIEPAVLPAGSAAGAGPESVGTPGGPPFWPPPPGWSATPGAMPGDGEQR